MAGYKVVHIESNHAQILYALGIAVLLVVDVSGWGLGPASRLSNRQQHRHNTAAAAPLFVSTNGPVATTTSTTYSKEEEKPILLDQGGSTLSGHFDAVFGDKKALDQPSKDRNKQLVKSLKSVLFDTLFKGSTVDRAYARFYALETIARMPYFSYLSVLHLLETLGQWRRADLLKVHFAESWNELHHLLIMEELGGNTAWWDRFIAQHIAFFYYWIVVAVYLSNPAAAYNLNQCVEEEAYATYNAFITSHADYLKTQEVPAVAKLYYSENDSYLFDAMHTGSGIGSSIGISSGDPKNVRRPVMETLYDVFTAIRDDEWEHVKTMECLQCDVSSRE